MELSAQESNTESSVEEACFDYTRSDGTYVAPHTRSTPLRGSFIASSSTGSSAGTVQVRGYIRSDGTYVAPHTRATPSRGSRSSSMASGVSNVTGVTSRDTVPVSGYMRADGTKVSGYTRAMPSPRTSQASSVTMKSVSSTLTTESPTKFYVDNAFNRKVGRVGKPIGTCIISNAAKGEKPQRVYKDNAANRRLDRVGQPIPPRKRNKIHEALEQNTVEKLRAIVRLLMSSQAIVQRDQSDYEEQVYALNMLEQQEVEEKWEAMDVDPSTDIARLSAYHVQGKIIARSELQLENKIGQGGFGVVYAGLWHETPIAFKKLHYQRMSKKHQESFTTEVAVLAALNHPNVVRMFGVVVETDNIGIVMEYCTNRSLFHAIFIICTIFSEEKKIEIVTQVASAVEYLHNHDPKIVHCDIKSENILLDKDNNAKLSDFGLSTIKNATESSQSNVGVIAPGKGTPRYSAPEVLRGEILKTDKLFPTDIYSLSIVVVEVVLEEEAYEGLSVRQLEANVGTGDLRPTLPDTLPKQVVDLLQNSWHSDPSERPTATEFHARWREISSFTS